MHMAFTWSPPNVSTTSWCQLKSTKEYSPTNASLDQMGNCLNCTTGLIFKTLPKALRTRGLSSAYQSNFFRSYHKFLQNSWPNLSSESWPRLNFITTWSISSKTMTKPRFILDSTFYKTSAEKNWPNSSFKSCLNFNFKILTKLFAQSLNKHLDFWPNLGFQICNKLLPTRSSSATVTTSTSFELASSHARVTSIKSTKQEWVSQSVSEWVSELVTRVNNDRTRVR